MTQSNNRHDPITGEDWIKARIEQLAADNNRLREQLRAVKGTLARLWALLEEK